MSINFSIISEINFLKRGVLPSFAVHQNLTQMASIPIFKHLNGPHEVKKRFRYKKYKKKHKENSCNSHKNIINSNKETQKIELKEIKFNIEEKKILSDGRILEGEFKGNKLVRGRVIFPCGQIQEGEFVNGKLNGYAKLTLTDGQIHEGQFKDGLLNEQGSIIFSNGVVHEGQFKDAQLHGLGKKKFQNGEIQEGEFKANRLDGQGKITWRGVIVEGVFKDDKLNGLGKKTYSNGEVQEGEYREDKLNGQGRIIWGKIIVQGEFKDDKLNGFGKKILSNGEIREGVFEDNRLNGQGKITLGKFIIQGEFKDDKLNGFGKKFFSNGAIHEGEFKEDKLNGFGKKIFSNGEIQQGEFKEGQFHKSPYPQIRISKKRSQHLDIKPPYIQNNVFEDLLNDIEPTTSEITEMYISGMRNLFFGLSIGQKMGKEVMSKQSGIDIKTIKTLEGSSSSVNLLYIFFYLGQLIERLKGEKDSHIEFLNRLQVLHDDLQRSLPFAFIAHMHFSNPQEEEILAQMVRDISQKLNQMKPNERILIPIGTKTHGTLLVFEKLESGAISPVHYNTGFGVENHVTKKMNKKGLSDHLNTLLLYYPIQKKYPSLELGQDLAQFESMLINIFKLKNDVSNDQKYNIKQISTFLENYFGEGIAGPSKPVQINGVCASQVLTAVIKDILGSKIYYNTYKLHLLTDMQAELQEITNGMAPLVSEIEEMWKFYPLHQFLLKKNQLHIDATQKLLFKLRAKA